MVGRLREFRSARALRGLWRVRVAGGTPAGCISGRTSPRAQPRFLFVRGWLKHFLQPNFLPVWAATSIRNPGIVAPVAARHVKPERLVHDSAVELDAHDPADRTAGIVNIQPQRQLGNLGMADFYVFPGCLPVTRRFRLADVADVTEIGGPLGKRVFPVNLSRAWRSRDKQINVRVP